MIPLKDDNPTSSRPIVTYFLIGLCVVVFLMQLESGCLENIGCLATYGLVPAILMGNVSTNADGITINILPVYVPIFYSYVYARRFYAFNFQYALSMDFCR